MAATTWEGRLVARAQIDTVTVANTWATGDTATITIGGKALVLTVGTDTTVTQVALAIKEMINNVTEADQTGTGDHTFSATNDIVDITATSAAGVVTVTADTAGVPFTMTASEVTAGDGTATRAAGTANQSPNDANAAGNWSNGVPTDIAIIKDSASSLKWNLDALAAVEMTSVTIESTFTGDIGLPPERVTAGATFAEPHEQYWQFKDIATLKIGEGDGTGSSRIKIDLSVGTNPSTVYVYLTAASSGGIPSVLLKSPSGKNNILYNYGGSVGIAALAGEVADFATITQSGSASELVIGADAVNLDELNVSAGTVDCRIAYTAANITGGTVTVGGVGVPAITNIYGGTVTFNSTATPTTVNLGGGTCTHNGPAPTNLNQTGGTVTINGPGAMTTLIVEGGTCYKNGLGNPATILVKDGTLYWNAADTCGTACSVYKDGILDLRDGAGTKIITPQLQLYPGAYVYAPAGNLTLTGGFKLNDCDFNDLGALQLGDNRACTAFP